METHLVRNTVEFHSLLAKYKKDTRWKFRGQSNTNWSLIPKAGRREYGRKDDQKLLRQWERAAVRHLQLNGLSVWGRLAAAQHYGLPTRLLDWTHNPLVAAFFAVVANPENDGAVFALRITKRIKHEDISPFAMENVVKYFQPDLSSPRVSNQQGHFTVHCPPRIELNEETSEGNRIEKIVVAADYKEGFVFELNFYGINYMTIFPDLDGVSRHLCWWKERQCHINSTNLVRLI